MKLSPSLKNLKSKYNLPLIPSLLRRGKGWLLDFIFPRFCLGCQKEISSKQALLVCQSCFNKIARNRAISCHICGLRTTLGTCRKCRSKTHLKGLYAAGFYHDPILREMIHCFKYNSIESLKKPLAELMISYIKNEFLTNNLTANKLKSYILVPIPLTLRRRINRGFNQSELLAKELSGFLNCPVVNLLKRRKFVLPQVEVSDWQKRKENVSGVFELSVKSLSKLYPTYPQNYRHPMSIILVDDVSTSGATLEEAAKVLKQAGVKEIFGLVVARG